MKRFKAKSKFSTSITIGGKNIWQAWAEGDERDLEPLVAELLQREVPGVLVEVKVPKPKVEKPKAESKVETKAGPTDDAKTRAVVDAPKRTRKTKDKS